MAYDKNELDNDTQAAITAGIALGDPKELMASRLLGVLVPAGARLEQIDLEKLQPRPSRKNGNVTLTTAASFIDWVNRNKTPETVIYAKESDTSFLAIFNGHAANAQPTPPAPMTTDAAASSAFSHGNSGWGDFTSKYGCPLSDEWKRWTAKSQHDKERKEATPHAEFLQFIEDNLLDIKTPESGKMLQLLHRFEARRDVKIASGKRLDNGDVAFAYSEDTKQVVAEGQSDLTLPSQFTLAIPVFKGGAIYEVDANLRYRAGAHGLALWFELVRPHKSLEHAFNGVSSQIAAGTSVPMFST